MSKKTLVLIIGLFLIVTGLLLLATTATKRSSSKVVELLPTPTPMLAQTMLSFSQNPFVVTNRNTNNTVDVVIDTQDKVSAVQLELVFNPKEITLVDIVPAKTTPFFPNPTVLLKKIDQRNGRITYAFARAISEQSSPGKGSLATVTFRLQSGVQQAKLDFSSNPQTIVTASGSDASVLKEATGTTISLQTNQ